MASQSLQASDAMICNTRALAWFEHKKTNDINFARVVNPSLIKSPKWENALYMRYGIFPAGNMVCDDLNAISHKRSCMQENTDFVRKGYQCMPTADSMFDDFLLIPCPINTFDNRVACDDIKCCSKRHQLFMNITKSKA